MISNKYKVVLQWIAFIKSLSHPQDLKRLMFKQIQEAARKDVEYVFGVFKARRALTEGPCCLWYQQNLEDTIVGLHYTPSVPLITMGRRQYYVLL